MSRILLSLREPHGRRVDVELNLRRDTVEAWTDGRCLAVFDREQFRDWLATIPTTPLVADDMTFTMRARGIAVAIAHRVPWTYPDQGFLRDLQALV